MWVLAGGGFLIPFTCYIVGAFLALRVQARKLENFRMGGETRGWGAVCGVDVAAVNYC